MSSSSISDVFDNVEIQEGFFLGRSGDVIIAGNSNVCILLFSPPVVYFRLLGALFETSDYLPLKIVPFSGLSRSIRL